MRCIDGENELILTCETQAEGVCILRCETRDPVVLLPDEIDGAPVTALGRYVLSGRAPDLSGRDTFSVRVTCGGPPPVHEADSIRAVTLPKQLKTVGSYAFYNCRSLEELTMTDSVSAFDGGSLMNCLSLHHIRLLAPPSGATCLPKILGETASELGCALSARRHVHAAAVPGLHRGARGPQPGAHLSAPYPRRRVQLPPVL